MAAGALISSMDTSLSLAPLPWQSACLGSLRSRLASRPVRGITRVGSRRQWRGPVVRAAGMAEPDSAGGSSIVDANMIVLRKRIQSLRTQDSGAQAEWMEWERTAYSNYRADICLLLTNLQTRLLSMRPSVALSFVSVLFAVLPVACILFMIALGTQLWTLHMALMDLLPSS